jgi:hypothetical protein
MPGALAIDSQLLLLYLVGATARTYIARHKRLRAYTEDDFDLLLAQIEGIESLVLTPNTLSETSNLIDHIAEPARGEIYAVLRAVLALPEAVERYVPSSVAARQRALPRLGLTDCALLDLCHEGTPLLTADLPLYLAAVSAGGAAVNFHHLRDAQD